MQQGGQIAIVQLDVTDRAQVSALWTKVPQNLRNVDILGKLTHFSTTCYVSDLIFPKLSRQLTTLAAPTVPTSLAIYKIRTSTLCLRRMSLASFPSLSSSSKVCLSHTRTTHHLTVSIHLPETHIPLRSLCSTAKISRQTSKPATRAILSTLGRLQEGIRTRAVAYTAHPRLQYAHSPAPSYAR